MDSAVDRREGGWDEQIEGAGTSAAPIVISDSDTDSDSSSSLMGTDDDGEQEDNNQQVCRYRTDRYHNQECERFFDCPSHVVARTPSEQSEEEEDDSRQEQEQEHEHEHEDEDEDEDEEIASSDEDSEVSDSDVEMKDVGESSAQGAGVVQQQARQDEDDSSMPQSSASSSRGEPAQERGSTPYGPGTLSGTQQNPIVLDSPVRTSSGETVGESSRTAASRPQVTARPSRSSASPSQTDITAPLPSVPPSHGPPAQPSTEGTGQRDLRDIALPRWQPDAEVTYCPICNTQFSIFVRKHHCRKCGRVVCNSCSPHRITIPYQYIVQPPGAPRPQPRPYAYLTGGGDVGSLGGGESVRLCNPCVPDPNITPPQNQDSQPQQQRTHGRSHSSLGQPYVAEANPVPSRFSSYLGNASGSFDPFSRSRSSTLQPGGPSSSRAPNIYSPTPLHLQHRQYPGSTGLYPPTSTASTPRPRISSSSSSRYPGYMDTGQSSSSGAPNMIRRLPPTPSQRQQPQYQLAEEDECPICHRELPSRRLPNYEAARESHITNCITSHSAYGGGSSGSPGAGGGLSGTPTSPPRRTGIFPYTASEKDCVDSAECSICLEEFEVGVKMARLECFCRFHRHCIDAWWQRHPGRCPMHQHDSVGY